MLGVTTVQNVLVYLHAFTDVDLAMNCIIVQ